jgi:hypothetical protein
MQYDVVQIGTDCGELVPSKRRADGQPDRAQLAGCQMTMRSACRSIVTRLAQSPAHLRAVESGRRRRAESVVLPDAEVVRRMRLAICCAAKDVTKRQSSCCWLHSEEAKSLRIRLLNVAGAAAADRSWSSVGVVVRGRS